MYGTDVRRHAAALMECGFSLRSISMSTGVNRATLRDWREHPEKALNRATCPRCADNPGLPEPHADYAYLLGLYLGDGCISRAGARARRCGNCASRARTPGPGLSGSASEPCARSGPVTASASSRNRAVPRSRAVPGTGRACSRSTGQAGNICERSNSSRGSVPLCSRIPGILLVGCSTRTAIGELTESGSISRMAIAGMSIRDICSPTSPRTFSDCAGRRWIGWGWRGGSRGGTRYRWLGGRRWRGWMNSSGPSTEGSG